MTLCPVISQSGYEIHARFSTHFALSAALFLLSWGNTLLSQVNHKATEKTEAGRGPWSWGFWSCLGQALLKAGPTTLGCPGPVKAWPCPRFHNFSGLVFQCLTSLLRNRFSLWFNWHFIFHMVPTGSISISALAFAFAGLGEVPDRPFLGLMLSGLLSG